MPASLPWQVDTYNVAAMYDDGEIVTAVFDVPTNSTDDVIEIAARETLIDNYIGTPAIVSIVLCGDW